MSAPMDWEKSAVLSYLGLRKAIGILGIALPFALLLGKWLLTGQGLEPTISHYYHTIMGDLFVGCMCAIGVFFASYRGPERKDDMAGDFACVCAIGVALFRTTPVEIAGRDWIGVVHLAFAVGFLGVLAYFCLCLFTKTDSRKTMTRMKKNRNLVYLACGWTILTSIVAIGLFFVLTPKNERGYVAFILESIAVVAFGISWLIKGEAFMKDDEDGNHPAHPAKATG